MKKRVLNPLPLFDEQSVFNEFDKHAIKHSHAYTIWRYIIKNPDSQPQTRDDALKAADIPKQAIEICFYSGLFSDGTTSRVINRTDARDGSTTKLIIELQDGHRIETVIMRYGNVQLPHHEALQEGHRFKSNKRATVCVSSQVGCAMGCRFCATGTMGIIANLTTGEILEQLHHAQHVVAPEQLSIRNLVFMGMGEPLDNYEAVCGAIRMMTHVKLWSMSPARVSVSTVGVVPRLRQMLYDIPNVCLALSLHAPDQETRLKIVPSARVWDINDLLDAADLFVEQQNDWYSGGRDQQGVKLRHRKHVQLNNENMPQTAKLKNRKRHLMLEYALIGPDVNCTVEHAQKLGQLISASPARLQNSILNIIPYNPTQAGARFGYEAPTQTTIDTFVQHVRDYGVVVLVRQELGQDVNAACGQLVVENTTGNTKITTLGDANVGDIEDAGGKQGGRRGRRPPPSELKKKKTTTQNVAAPARSVNRIRIVLVLCALLTCRLAYRLYSLYHHI